MKKHSVTVLGLFVIGLVSVQVCAQETGQEFAQDVVATPQEPVPTEANTARPNPPVISPPAINPQAESAPDTAGTSNKPRYTEATISLQTTVTGNQEQPRVLYILPWQSPLSGDIEFQTLSSQQDEVFGHLEREELRRSLEAEAALNTNKSKK